MDLYRLFFKQIFDFLIALIGLLILAPLIGILIVVLMVVNDGKPFFLQPRPGKNERLFKIIKFKTMKDIHPSTNHEVHSLNRVTKVGAFIRKYSLDEILQLVNVIKGDMSLIGPRPLLVEYLPLYNESQKKRHHVKPGMTGWAQVKGRNAISWSQKFEYDLWYVNNLSFKLDIKIFFLTILKIFQTDGVNTNQNMTMPPFTGNK